jgi:serine/threonine protein phosphatase PrpC
MFCVFDGHGDNGHHCAQFSKKKLPQVLAKYLRQQRVKVYSEQLKKEGKPVKGAWQPAKWPYLSAADFEECCKKSFVETNKAMHEDKNVSIYTCVS